MKSKINTFRWRACASERSKHLAHSTRPGFNSASLLFKNNWRTVRTPGDVLSYLNSEALAFFCKKRSHLSEPGLDDTVERNRTAICQKVTVMKPPIKQILTRIDLHQLPFLCPATLPSHFCPGRVRALWPTVSALCL